MNNQKKIIATELIIFLILYHFDWEENGSGIVNSSPSVPELTVWAFVLLYHPCCFGN